MRTQPPPLGPRSRSAILTAFLLVATNTTLAADDDAKQVNGPKPSSRSTLRLCLDPDCSKPHPSNSVAAASIQFPRPVLKTAASGAVLTKIDIGGTPTEVWLHPSEIRTGLKTEGTCLLAQRTIGPVGATRAANEGCLPPPEGARK